MNKKIIIFVVLLLVGWIGYNMLFTAPKKSIVGEPAPLFEISGPSNQAYKLKDSLGKKVVLINIWATWCPTCRDEVPILNRLHREIDPERFEVISILVDDAPNEQTIVDNLKKFTDKIPIKYPVYFDKNYFVADTYGTFKLPESYLIDLNGIVTYKHVGPISKWDEEGLKERIRQHLP